ncbi:heat stress transcription factor B-4-like protein [Tanacetum coccineum]
MPDCILTPPIGESVITYIQLSGVQRVDIQSHVLPIIQSQFIDIKISFVSQQATDSQVIDDVMRQLSFDETELDREAGFADVARSGVDSSGLKVSTEVPIVEEVGTQEFSLEDVVIEDYVSSGEDMPEQGNWSKMNHYPLIGTNVFYDDEGIDTAYEIKYDVQSSEDVGTDDDDNDDIGEYLLVDEENEIVEPDVDVHLFDGFDSDPGNDEEKNYRKRRLAELRTEIEGVINASGQWKYSFYSGQKFTTPKEAKDRVYLHSIESKRNLKLYKNDGVSIRARCDGKVHVFTMSQGTGPTGLNHGMKIGPGGSSGPTTRSKKGRTQEKTNSHKIRWVNPDIPVKAVQDQLQRELEVQISMSKAFRAKAKAEREIRGDHVLQYSMIKDYVVELQSTNPSTTVKIAVERNTDPSLPNRGPFPGQVLVAIGLDSNNGIYPLVYALVEAEKHKYCLRYIHENMKQGWCGQAYKDLLWRAASATNVRDFEKYMLELKTMNPKAHERLNKIPAEHLARSHFLSRAKSDLLLNNICEVFNGKIVGGRDKPVITLLEYIREYCMKRIMNVQGVIDKCTGPLTPTATRCMESIKKEARLMKVQWNGANKYLVSGSLGDQCVVDVVSMTCSCRKWELTGIPCKHVVAACWNMALNDRASPPPETWVGRPRKKRKRSKHEDEPFVKDGKLSRKGRTITCQSCGNTRHNKATCKGQEPVVGQDGLGGPGAGAVIGLSATAGEGGAGVASQGSSRSRWTKRRVQTERISPRKGTPTQPASQPSTSSQAPVSETRNADGREIGNGVPTQSSATGGASKWSFL